MSAKVKTIQKPALADGATSDEQLANDEAMRAWKWITDLPPAAQKYLMIQEMPDTTLEGTPLRALVTQLTLDSWTNLYNSGAPVDAMAEAVAFVARRTAEAEGLLAKREPARKTCFVNDLVM